MLGLYLHIPFCSSICNYCNFNRGLFDAALKARYVDALEQEILRTGRGEAVSVAVRRCSSDAGNFPGVCVQSGSSPMTSPVMPYARARQPPQWPFISHAPQRPPSEDRRRTSAKRVEVVQRSSSGALRRLPANTGR